MSGHQPRRSFVLIAVLVIVGSALLVATSLLYVAQSEAAGASGTADAAQSRALAWSGVQAVMSRLNDQRDRILAGDVPELDSPYVMYETGNRAGVVRVMEMGQPGLKLIAENGRIDVNHVDAERLTQSGLLESAAASSLIAWCDQPPNRLIQSIAELQQVPGGVISAEMLYGSLGDFQITTSQSGDTGTLRDSPSASASQGLANHLTVFTAEPNLQQNGRLRINLNQPWSEELARLVEERFGREAADLIKQIYESGTTFERDAKIVQVLRFFKTPPEEWPPILDAFTTQSDELRTGRLNINTASVEALQSLPGITPELALQLISVREELSAGERASVAWPVVAQVITPEAFEKVVGLITTRSWCYRVRVEAGTSPAEQIEGPLSNRVILEAVIDLASPRPRVAYLRDITMLEDTVRIAHQASLLQPSDFERSAEEDRTPEVSTSAPDASESPTVGPADEREENPKNDSPKPTSRPAAESLPGRVGRWIATSS